MKLFSKLLVGTLAPLMVCGYHSTNRVFLICQDNVTQYNGRPIPPTANDRDTIRHEAIHVIQDCRAGRINDGYLGFVIDNKNDRVEFVQESLAQSQIRRIINSYSEHDDVVIELELEAFAGAASIDAQTLAQGVANHCRL